MGDASIIARLLANGHVQYGWSGNGGYFSMGGIRLLLWYQEPKNVEYLLLIPGIIHLRNIKAKRVRPHLYKATLV